ncbi:MAG: 16S rRNA processing protein RimM [Burkholderiaceae bacterium]|nr:16S rRNA processing protein RimM [Burkholderiaceae bacterium]
MRRSPVTTEARVDGASSGAARWVAVGVVRGAFGVRGAVKVEPYAGPESSVLEHARRWRLDRPARGTVSRSPLPLPADITADGARRHGAVIVATLDPPLTREEAIALKGAEVLVDRADFPALDEDEYYWTDLIGCRVSNPAGEDLGVVDGLEDHGAHSVLRLDNGILIPFVAAHVLDVAPQAGRILVDWSADWL